LKLLLRKTSPSKGDTSSKAIGGKSVLQSPRPTVFFWWEMVGGFPRQVAEARSPRTRFSSQPKKKRLFFFLELCEQADESSPADEMIFFFLEGFDSSQPSLIEHLDVSNTAFLSGRVPRTNPPPF